MSILVWGLALHSTGAWAHHHDQNNSQAAPDCLDTSGNAVPVNNSQVMQWEYNTPNQFLARGHVQGTFVQSYADENGHNHFELQIGSDPADTIEIVYNIDFGALPELQAGMQIEACGDYITSTAQAGSYPPSPDRAIIHWVHRNPSSHGHPSGYVDINGVLYGQGNGTSANYL